MGVEGDRGQDEAADAEGEGRVKGLEVVEDPTHVQMEQGVSQPGEGGKKRSEVQDEQGQEDPEPY